MMAAVRLGVLVNPVAGMGGRVGLHGTDGPAVLEDARRRGAQPVAPLRARRALHRLRTLYPDLEVITVGGAMGLDLLDAFPTARAVHEPATGATSAADTRAAATAMADAGVTLLLFAGGDGTAHDVVEAIGTDVPVLGVPSGVKMHSGVFAVGPEAAGETAARYLADPDRVGTVSAEVLDLTSSGPRALAVARVPDAGSAVQRAKAGGAVSDDADLAALGREVAAEMTPGRLYLLGPGTTVEHVSSALGVPAGVLGVDAVLDGQLIGGDLSEDDLLSVLAGHGPATLVLGVVGGQGFLLGRGNQQLSARVLAAGGADGLEILAARSKVAALVPPVLLVDLGDAEAQDALTGYRRVRTGRSRSTVLKVVAQ